MYGFNAPLTALRFFEQSKEVSRMQDKTLLNTKEIASYLNINEKMVYTLVSDKGLPATKVTGKWLFPKHLVDQWLENQTMNYPESSNPLPPYHGLVIINGSNDILLEKTISLFNKSYPDHLAVFGNLGSLGGIRALRRNLCHMASSHLLQENELEYNFGFAKDELKQVPVVVNFCKREQGLLLAKGNPKNITRIIDLGRPGIKIVNRPLGTGTRLLLDKELKKVNIAGDDIEGYKKELDRHLDVGIEVLAGRIDAAPGIKAVAGLLDLDFLPLRWERFDLIINKDRFFEQGIQFFLGLLRNHEFKKIALNLAGYDISGAGEIVFPQV
jgi:excisionase family DNA binding protein